MGFCCADQKQQCRQTIERRVAGEEILTAFECDFLRRDGGYLILEIYDSLIQSSTGEITGIRSVLLDVTDRRLAEQLLANEVTERERLTGGVAAFQGGSRESQPREERVSIAHEP